MKNIVDVYCYQKICPVAKVDFYLTVCFSDLEEEILPSKSRTAPGPIRVQSSPIRNPGLSTSPAQGGPVIVQPKGQKVAELSRTIEMQLAVSTCINTSLV